MLNGPNLEQTREGAHGQEERTSQRQFSAAFEFAPIGMALLDTQSTALRVNHALCQMLGYRLAEMVGATSRLVSHPDDLEEDLELRSQMLAGAFPSYQRDKRYLHRSGEVVWAHISCSMVHDADGQPAHFLLQMQDITHRRAAEAALRESEERFRATFEQAALGIVHIGLDGGVLRVNGSMCRMHGYSREEFLKLRASDLMEDLEAGNRDLQTLLDGRALSYTAERRLLRKGGDAYPARVSVTLARGDAAAPYIISIVEDLTEQVRSQQRIREQAAMLDQASDAIVIQDSQRRVRYWNQGAERLFTWTAAQAEGRSFAELLGAAAMLSEQDSHALLEHGSWVGEVHCRAADGRMLLVERRLTVVRRDGDPMSVLSVNTDVTERRRAEREVKQLNGALEQRIRQRTAQLEERNEELRTFAYSLAHDLRAPLATADGYSRQLELTLGEQLDDRARHYLRRMRHGVQTMSDLTDALLSLANLSREPLQCAPVDLSQLARAWLDQKSANEPQRAVSVAVADTPPMQGDARLLKVLVENLLDNAWKFTTGRTDAQIEFGVLAPGAADTPVFFVRDNGAGFDSAYASKLFTPFQRLHAAHEFPGTGIGLAIVRKIALRHGGRAWGESPADGGAVFCFTIVGPVGEGPLLL